MVPKKEPCTCPSCVVARAAAFGAIMPPKPPPLPVLAEQYIPSTCGVLFLYGPCYHYGLSDTDLKALLERSTPLKDYLYLLAVGPQTSEKSDSTAPDYMKKYKLHSARTLRLLKELGWTCISAHLNTSTGHNDRAGKDEKVTTIWAKGTLRNIPPYAIPSKGEANAGDVHAEDPGKAHSKEPTLSEALADGKENG